MNSTPLRKGYKAGQVFKVLEDENDFNGLFRKDSLIVLKEGQQHLVHPNFICLTEPNKASVSGGKEGCISLQKVKRIYPVEVIEEISLMGRIYNKVELEEALKNVEEL